MKKIILSLALVVLSLQNTAIAEWKTEEFWNNLDTTNTEAVNEALKTIDKQFILVKEREGSDGILISAFNKEITQCVRLRCNYDKVDYSVFLVSPLNQKSCVVYLDLIDDDKFLIESIKIDNISGNYTGKLYGHFNMNWKDFKKIKYFEISVRL